MPFATLRWFLSEMVVMMVSACKKREKKKKGQGTKGHFFGVCVCVFKREQLVRRHSQLGWLS